ncbi:hypothetical protein [Mucilaginibacter lappiensis]|uniref:hypothetical protein n=1 Tax=Mucilaginibacter lappiensis TaxID=354630 RepID=UPI003D1D2313
MKALLFTSLLFIAAFGTNAQTISRDSAMFEIANTDAKRFKLDHNTMGQFRAHHFPNTSDHFKPTASMVSDTSLLKDSAYIKAFKMAAYQKTLHRRTTGHHVLIIGSIAVAVVVIVGVIALGSWNFGNR